MSEDRSLIMMLANPLVSSPPHEVSELEARGDGIASPDTLRNVKAVVHLMEQLIGVAGDTIEGEDIRGLQLILQCVDHALEYELAMAGGAS